jgi:putative tricarboxylic transport membrane protein
MKRVTAEGSVEDEASQRPEDVTEVETAGDPEPAGLQMSARAGDLVAGLLFVAIGLFSLYASRDLAFRGEFAAGPGFFPRILAIILIAAGGALAIKQFVRPSTGRVPLPSGAGAAKIAATLGALLGAVLLIEVLGFILTAFLLIAVLLFGVERKFTITAVVVSVALPIAFWTLFAVLLGARLPAGLVSF